MLDPQLAGRLSFSPRPPTRAPLPPGLHPLGIADSRDTLLLVPETLDPRAAAPLMVLFHGGGGCAEKILPMMRAHAERRGFLLLVPQSMFPTWDIVIAGNGPDRERLHRALHMVADHHALDPRHIAFAGHSDGGSYALSLGLTNGHFVTHILASSAGFMSVHSPEGAPRVFICHGIADTQIPIHRSARVHAALLKDAGYDVTYVEYNGPHAYQPAVIGLAADFFLADRDGAG